MKTKQYKDLKVKNISKCRGGMNPLFRIEFSDGFSMQSNEFNDYIDKKYYKLMYEAIDSYSHGTPIGYTSAEDLYYY